MERADEEWDDGSDILPDLRFADVLQQRPAAFDSPLQILRITLAVTVSWVVGYWLSPASFGIFAPLTTLLVISTSVWSTFGLALQRVAGTAAGVLLATLWVSWVGVTWWSVLVAMLVSLLIASRLPLSLGGQFVIPTSVLFVFALGQVTWEQAAWRVVDVALGGAIGFIALYLPPPKPQPRPFEKALEDYRDRILALLANIAEQLESQVDPLGPDVMHDFVVESRKLRQGAEKCRQALVALAETTAFNPRGRSVRGELANDALRLRRLASIGIHVRAIAGVVNKQYDREWISPALSEESLVSLLRELVALGRLALGGPGERVATANEQAVDSSAAGLDARLRRVADGLVQERPSEVLESVSLVGRLQYVTEQLRDFHRPPGEMDDRDEEP